MAGSGRGVKGGGLLKSMRIIMQSYHCCLVGETAFFFFFFFFFKIYLLIILCGILFALYWPRSLDDPSLIYLSIYMCVCEFDGKGTKCMQISHYKLFTIVGKQGKKKKKSIPSIYICIYTR
jgi:hypothetical protein